MPSPCRWPALDSWSTARSAARRDFDALDKIPGVRPVVMDVTKPEQVKRGIGWVGRREGSLYGLVNNAAVIDVWPMVEIEDRELVRSFEVNLFGVQRVVREAAPLLAKSHGRIVNISSVEGLVTTKFAGPYEMTKFALEAYSDNLRRELRRYGVSVSVVEPGGFRSNYAKTAAKLLAKRAKARRPVLMKKEVEEIAKTWDAEVLDVERRPPPSLVADAVSDALTCASPKHRYLVTASRAEFLWTMERVLSKAIEVNRGSGYALSKTELRGLLDTMWARTAEG